MSKAPDYELITRLKDSNSSNLNEVFETYGCSTLEAKVPVVERPMVDQLKEADTREQILGTLALKSEAASHALKGRAPRTRNKDLRVVEVGGQFILEAGEERERSPVDRGELDDELEAYARESARIKANKLGIELPDYVPSTPALAPKPETKAIVKREMAKKKVENEENWDDEEPERGDLDNDLDRYMREAARQRAQKKKLTEQLDRMDVMMRMEDDDEQ